MHSNIMILWIPSSCFYGLMLKTTIYSLMQNKEITSWDALWLQQRFIIHNIKTELVGGALFAMDS